MLEGILVNEQIGRKVKVEVRPDKTEAGGEPGVILITSQETQDTIVELPYNRTNEIEIEYS